MSVQSRVPAMYEAMPAAMATFAQDFSRALVCLVISFFVMEETLSRAAIVFLCFFVGIGVVIGVCLLILLAVLSKWPDDEVEF